VGAPAAAQRVLTRARVARLYKHTSSGEDAGNIPGVIGVVGHESQVQDLSDITPFAQQIATKGQKRTVVKLEIPTITCQVDDLICFYDISVFLFGS
jgi:hypothetical protein